jgi:hypothetical protein
MADPNVARFPSTAAPDIGAIVDALLAFLMNLETAEAALGSDREKNVASKIDAFVTASKTAVAPADALKARLDLEAIKKTFDDQEAALDFWEKEANNRLDRLEADYGEQMLDALDKRLTQLHQQEAIAQGDVNEVKTLISEFEARRQHLEAQISKRRQKKGGGAPSA